MALGTPQEWTDAFEDTPAGSDPGSDIDNRFHDLKRTLRDVLQRAGILITGFNDNVATDVDKDGFQIVDALGSASPKPWTIRDSTDSSDVVEVTDTTATFTGTISGPNVTSGSNPGHTHDVTATVAIPRPAATGVIPDVMVGNDGNGTLTLVGWRVIAWTPAVDVFTMVGETFDFTGITYPGSATTVSTTVSRSIGPGAYHSGYVADGTTIPTNHGLRFNVTALGTPGIDGLTAILKLRRG